MGSETPHNFTFLPQKVVRSWSVPKGPENKRRYGDPFSSKTGHKGRVSTDSGTGAPETKSGERDHWTFNPQPQLPERTHWTFRVVTGFGVQKETFTRGLGFWTLRTREVRVPTRGFVSDHPHLN